MAHKWSQIGNVQGPSLAGQKPLGSHFRIAVEGIRPLESFFLCHTLQGNPGAPKPGQSSCISLTSQSSRFCTATNRQPVT